MVPCFVLVMASFGYSFSSVHVRACVCAWVCPWVCAFLHACLCFRGRRDVRIALGFLSVCFSVADAQRYNLALRASFWGHGPLCIMKRSLPMGCIFFSCGIERKDCDQGPKRVSTKKIREYILELLLLQFSQGRDHKLGLYLPVHLI